jgi:hypothetical protein
MKPNSMRSKAFPLSGEWGSETPEAAFFAQLLEGCPRGELVLQRRLYQDVAGDWQRKGGYTLMRTHLPESRNEVLALIEAEEAQLNNKLDR